MKKLFCILLVSGMLVTSCSKILDGEKGEKYYENGDFKNAEKYLLKAIEKDKKDVIAMNYLGTLNAKQNKKDLAEKYWKLALENGNYTSAGNLGMFYIKNGNEELGVKMLETAIENKEESNQAAYNLGLYYYREKRYVLAKKYLKMAVENGNEEAKDPLKDLEDTRP